MAKTMLAISLLVGVGACSSGPAPTAHRATTSTGPADEPTTTEPSTTTLPEPTTTTTEAPVAAETAPATTRTTRARSAPTTTAYVAPDPVEIAGDGVASGDYSSLLACIRSFEQNDNPTKGPVGYASDTGNGFYGAYQFTLPTWRSVGGSGNPAHAEPSEQDNRAVRLYERDGLGPWPTPAVHCRRYEP